MDSNISGGEICNATYYIKYKLPFIKLLSNQMGEY